MSPKFSHGPASAVRSSAPEPGLTRLVGAYNEKLFLAEHRMEQGWIGAAHSHPHDQMAYVVSGRFAVRAVGQTVRVSPADHVVIRVGVEQQAPASDHPFESRGLSLQRAGSAGRRQEWRRGVR